MNSAHSKPLPPSFPTAAVRGHDSAGPGACPEEGRLARSVRGATVAMALAALAACGTTSSSGSGADYSSNSSVSTSGGNVSSPAAERVVDGVVELALTDQLLPDFDAARARKLGTVHDGQQLYLYLRSTRPLGEIAHPVDPYGKNSFSGYPHLFVQIGDNQSLRIINTCYVTLTPAEAKATELIVPLAPLTNRVGDLPTDCWLETVTRADAVRQTLEVRLAGFPGKFESWLPVPDLLGVVAVDTDLSQGSNAWGQMLRAKPGKSPELPKGRQGARRSSERDATASKPVAASTEGRAPAQAGSSAPDASRADAAAAAGRAQTDTSPRTQAAAETPDRAAAQTAATTQAAAPAEAGAQTAPAATPADRARSERESRIAAAMAAAGLTGGTAAATSGSAASAAPSAGNAAKAPAAQDTITRNEIVSMNQGAKAAEQPAQAQDTQARQKAAAQTGAPERSSDDARKAVAEQGAATARSEGREAASARATAAAAATATTAGAAAGRAADADSAARPLPAQATLAALPAGARLSAVTPLRPAPRQAVGTTRMVQQLQSMTSTLLGREPSETYFIDRRWQVQRDQGSARGRNRQVIRAIAVFRGEECSWQSLMVTRRPGAGTLSEVVADGDEVRIPCPDLKAEP